MNPLLKKEIRLLLPAWVLTLVLALVAAFLFQVHDEPGDAFDGFTPVWLGVMILCASSFGREFNLGTFSSLLAQPFPRQQYWVTKVGVLVAALVSVLAVYGLGTGFHLLVAMRWAETAWLTVLLLTAIAGGLWMALLVRQMMAVIWLVVLAPAALCTPFLLVLSHFNAADSTVSVTMSVLLFVYAVTGIAASWLIFQRAQDAPWSGGTITLPEWLSASVMPGAGTDERHRTPWRALIRKEIYFNQVLLLGMAGLFLLDLGELGVRLARREAAGDFNQILQILGIVVWALVPLVIGCTSIAEERKLGTLEGQLCLPVSARRQYVVKLGFTLFFGGLLSSLFPVIVEALAGAARLKADEPPAAAIFFMTAAMCAIALVGFHASSLTRNVLQALPLAVGFTVGIGVVASGFIWLAGFNGSPFSGFILWSFPLPSLILAVLLPGMVVWLAWRNFCRLPETGRIWRRNVLGFAGAIVLTMVASVLIYHRVWEKLTPFEPAHGPARWTVNQPPVATRMDLGNSLLVTFPDGRNWYGFMTENDTGLIHNQMVRELAELLTAPRMQGHFIEDSNWVSLAAGFVDFWRDRRNNLDDEPDMVHIVNSRETVGVKVDGTLWVSEKPSGPHWNTNVLVQFGTETDWQQVMGARSFSSVLLLKKDGTLWRWGSPGSWDTMPANWAGLRAQTPRQIGTNSDWQRLVQVGWPLAQKKDGTLWAIDFQVKEQRDAIFRDTNIDQGTLGGPGWDGQKLAVGYGPFNADIHRDGTLWIWGDNLYRETPGHQKFAVLRSSAETNWVGVAVSASEMIALKSDGTLWLWGGELSHREYAEEYTRPPRRLGIHGDWVALTRTWWGVTTLAADGSLWVWPESGYYSDAGMMLCEPEPKPIRLGNVFAAN